MSEKIIKYTNATASSTFNEMSGRYVDTDLDFLDRQVEMSRVKLGKVNFFTELDKIGIDEGTETVEKIVTNLPSYSILVYHKKGESIPFYPERTGLLIVFKGENESRVQFSYTGYDFTYVAFYDSLRGIPGELWSGWKKLVSSKDGIIISDKMICRAFGNGGSTLMHNSLDGNGKNLGYSGSRFLQVCSQYGYFDRIEVKQPVVVTSGTFRKEKGVASTGMNYFDTELKKPIWFDGEKWVDSQGNQV